MTTPVYSRNIWVLRASLSRMPRNDRLNKEVSAGVPRAIVDCFTVLCRYCISYKFMVCGNPARSKSTGTIFPTALAHFLSLRHILLTLTILQMISLLSYLLYWSMISDRWWYFCNCLGNYKPCPYQTANFTDKCCVCSDYSTHWPAPHLSPFP